MPIISIRVSNVSLFFLNGNIPSTGREIQKRRPALVVSTDNYNLVTGLVAVCPITSTKKEHFIPLNENHQIKGYVNALQVKTLGYKALHWKK
ncbi:type II toxin-antitoxin system PemK/MazF family toxin [Enterococcus faecium]|uniref:type II toxin-antitoxin system PemK/MazF family toxin n=1 Tax=Enterococcus faecium TaxID=1352 RepID=UPI001F5B5A52|nr:type II toxin-antitoxin system PemK/MazF family toxin [Enterococcus faecium]